MEVIVFCSMFSSSKHGLVKVKVKIKDNLGINQLKFN